MLFVHDSLGLPMSTAYETISDVDLVARWRTGDEDAATELYRRYVARLVNLIGSKISPRMNSRVGAEDIVQSVFRTLFERVRRGEFRFEEDGQFWKLLVTIALNKWRNMVRFHQADGRSLKREGTAIDAQSTDMLLASRLVQQTTVAESVIFADLLENVLSRLDELERKYLLMRLQGDYTQSQIAAELQITDRTVRRMTQRIYERVADILGEDNSDSDVV